jgi:predicted dehydrogenase
MSLYVIVIGTGSSGMRHLEALRRIPNVHAIAVPQRHTRFLELADEGYTVCDNLDQALKRWSPGLCIIASDTGRHLDHALTSIANGYHLLVEKPMAINARDALRMWDAARAEKRGIYVGCVLRFCKSLQGCREMLGELGQIHSVRIECQSYLPEWRISHPYRDSYSARMDEGGVLRDLVHEIDYAGWLFGWPRDVYAKLKNLQRLGIDADEAADLIWDAQSGATISIRLDYLSRPPRRVMTICGEHGTLTWDGIRHHVVLALNGQPNREADWNQTRDEMFEAQIHAFIASATQGTPSLLATGIEGVQALAICDAARRSAVSGRQELVEYS